MGGSIKCAIQNLCCGSQVKYRLIKKCHHSTHRYTSQSVYIQARSAITVHVIKVNIREFKYMNKIIYTKFTITFHLHIFTSPLNIRYGKITLNSILFKNLWEKTISI